jgi:hypothetical protein
LKVIWTSTYIKNGETFVVTSSDAEKFFTKFKNSYQARKQIDPAVSSLETIDKIKSLIVDDQISVHALIDELVKLDQIIDNPMVSDIERKNLLDVRKIIEDLLREYGSENPKFLENFNEAEIAVEENRKLRLDPEILELLKILFEDGYEKFCQSAKKMIQTKEGKDKLQKIFEDSSMDGENFLDLLEKIKID